MKNRTPSSLSRFAVPRLLLMAAVSLIGHDASAQIVETLRLDRKRVIELSSVQAPEVVLARARARETRALRLGASARAPSNPEFTVSAGPHIYPDNSLTPDWALSLQWPVDVSGSRGARMASVEEAVHVADDEVLAMVRTTTAEALDLLVRSLGATERARLEAQRATLDESLMQVAQARRRAGTTGDTDVALARVLRADSQARLHSSEAERDAALLMLRMRLGIAPTAPIELGNAGLDDEAPPLPQILAGLPARADLVVFTARLRAAQAEASLQKRLGVPVPRFFATGGRSNEYYFEAGVQLPLPVYQRNQANRAVAEARIETGRIEEGAAQARAESEVRAAYTLYLGAQAAYRTLTEAIPSIADAEHLATRSYELGQDTLASVLTARREVLAARMALVDAQIAVRRTRLGVDLASGNLP